MTFVCVIVSLFGPKIVIYIYINNKKPPFNNNKYKLKRYSFADPIKYGCKEMFGFSDEQCWGNLKEIVDERYGVTPREILQVMGTEMLREGIQKILPNWKIKDQIWIERFNEFYRNIDIKYGVDTTDMHPSEKQNLFIKEDFIIENNSTISDLYNEINNIMAKVW